MVVHAKMGIPQFLLAKFSKSSKLPALKPNWFRLEIRLFMVAPPAVNAVNFKIGNAI